MNVSRFARRPGREAMVRLGGAVVCLAVAGGLYSRFDIDGSLSRDEGIYAYGGRQLAHGVAPYASIFDAKAPLATFIAGLAAVLARVVHRNDVYVIRVAFFACAVLTVLAVYLLAARLFGSTPAGVVAAVVFASGWPFAVDALAGPDAKTPGVMFAVLSMWLMAGRQWIWAAVAGSLAFLVWQPLVFYPAVAVLLALTTTTPPTTRARRRRTAFLTVAGAAVPVLLTVTYFAVVGALGRFVESALVFPLTGVRRGAETAADRVAHIAGVVNRHYGFGGVLFWVGLALLLLLVGAHLVRGRAAPGAAFGTPLVGVVLLTLVLEGLYATTDFQSYPDLYPFLPYPALGIAGAVAAALHVLRSSVARRVACVTVLVAGVGLVAATWVSFTDDPANDDGWPAQRADACAVRRAQVPGTPVWSLGDPAVLVAAHRRNPDRFVYLSSGVGLWKIEHTAGGFDGWTRQIELAGPSVVVVKGWTGPVRERMGTWLSENGYLPRFAGKWHLFVTPTARARAARKGVALTFGPTDFATGPGGRALQGRACG